MSLPSTTTALSTHPNVYVSDDDYVWLPARVLEINHDKTTAQVLITLPSHWHTSTILCDDSSIEDLEDQLLVTQTSSRSLMQQQLHNNSTLSLGEQAHYTDHIRTISLLQYPNGELPKQNVSLNKRDMADLQYLHEPAILYNLKERHAQSHPYTRVGDIVVAMNPYVWLPHLYTAEMRDLYAQALIWRDQNSDEDGPQGFGSLYDKLGFDPHVYEVSCLAYRGLAVDQRDQAILVTGESGAGKTETVKIVLQHLATLEQSRPGGEPFDSTAATTSTTNRATHKSGADTVRRVLESSPVFEAFGNAKTLRNDNSSRFGKFTQLQFKVESPEDARKGGRVVPYCRLAGSTCVTYLLEKSRVVSHSPGERTYHIFYELLAAPSSFKKEMWPFFANVTAEDFTYIAGSSHVQVQSDLEDSALWPRVLEALTLFSFDGEELYTLMRALGIILQLGNLTFEYDPTRESQEGSTIVASTEELETLSDMMGIDGDELESALTLRIIKTAYEEVQVKLRPSVAKEACDALAKEIYSRVFDVLVRRINAHTGAPDPNAVKYGVVSLLDIFGFERFPVNRFEQLCINYANEAMQFKYLLDNFRQIKEDYIEEGIDIFNFSVMDNSSVIQLLEGRIGLIVALNEECIRPNGNDESFVYKIKIVHKEDPRLVDEKLHLKTEFGIRHFAGPVKYDATKFVERNTDKLPDGLLYCVVKTSNSLIQREFQTLIEDHESRQSAEVVRKKKKTHRTVLEKFRSQLKDLMSALEETKTRYIRCIKPNEVVTPKLTDHYNTMRQLECAGLVTAVLFSRESYPTKLGYDAFLERFAPLMSTAAHKMNLGALTTKKEKATYYLATLLANMVEESPTCPFVCGKTRVFFKAGALEVLENQRHAYYSGKATILQKWIRAKQGEARLKMVRSALIRAQAYSRAHVERNRFLRKKEAATILQSWVRGKKAARIYQGMRQEVAASRIQSQWRGRTKRLEWHKVQKAVEAIQRVVRNRHNREALSTKLLVCVEEARMDQKLQQLKELVANNGAGLPQAGSSRQIEATVLGDIENMFDYLRQELFALRGKNADLKSGLSVAENDKRELLVRAQTAEAAAASSRLHMAELAKVQGAMTSEIQKQRQGASELRREHRASIVVKDSEATLRKEFQLALAEKDKEISNLQKVVRRDKVCCEDEKNKLKEELAVEQEQRALEVSRLQVELKKTQDALDMCQAKLLQTLDAAQDQREQEAARSAAELTAVRQEKDSRIITLQREVESLRQQSAPGTQRGLEGGIDADLTEMRADAERTASARTGRAKRFHEVATKLEAAMNPETLLSILEKRSGSAQAHGVSSEVDVSMKMKKMVRYLADLYSLEEASQSNLNKETMAKINTYLIAAQPTQTIAALEQRISHLQGENNELKAAVLLKECQRCTLRDARRRNLQRNSIAHVSS